MPGRVCLLLLFTLGVVLAQAQSVPRMIDGPGDVGQYSSIASGGTGVFVSYYDADNGDLKLAVCTSLCDRTNASWTVTTVDSAGDVGRYTSLAINGAGNPLIAYYDATNNALKLATCTGGCTTPAPAWIVTTVDRGSGDSGRYASLVGGDNPMVAYYDQANGDLKLATCMTACATSSPAWTITTVDGAGDVGRFAVMRTDFTRPLIIAYADASNGRLKTAICTVSCTSGSPSWTFSVIDSLDASVEMGISLALNNGAPSISYYDTAHGHLKLATCNTSCGTSSPAWVTSTIDAVGDAGRWSALVLNGHIPGIAYFGNIRNCTGPVCHEVNELRFAVCFPEPARATSDMPCAISTLDDRGVTGVEPAMRGGDSVSISYYEASGRDLKFIQTHMDEVLALRHNYTSLWWDPEESGWGINFAHQGDIVFGTLFTYDASGEPMWLVMSAGRKQSGNTYSGALYRTRGASFDARPFPPITPSDIEQVGTMTVGFAGDSASLAYTVDGVTVNKTVRKQAFAAARAPRCQNWTGPRNPLNGVQDLWWNPNEAGWGINFAHQGDTLFATLFTYDAARRPTWFVMSAGRKQADGSFFGELYRTRGAAFNAAPFPPIGPEQLVQVGTMRVQFPNDIEHGTLTYSVNGVTVTKAITRQVFSTPGALCGH